MKNIIMFVALFFGVHLFAGLFEDGLLKYDGGDLNGAKAIWTKSCEQGSMKSCKKLGVMYYYGYGVVKDQIKAKELYVEVCDSGDTESCRKVADMYNYGYSVKQDKAKAVQLYKKACDGNDEMGCKNFFDLKRKGY